MTMPQHVDVFTSGEVGLEVHFLSEVDVRYWITSGLASIEVKEDDFGELINILKAYEKEELKPSKVKGWFFRLFSGLVVVAIVGFVIAALVGGIQ
jgi:hypothetical protein